jgi:hypothetical protein
MSEFASAEGTTCFLDRQNLEKDLKDLMSYCQNGLGAESRSGQEIRKKSKKVDIYAILSMVLSQNSIPHPQDDTKR